jgi:hypothetical protein
LLAHLCGFHPREVSDVEDFSAHLLRAKRLRGRGAGPHAHGLPGERPPGRAGHGHSGPPPIQPIGGLGPIASGGEAWLALDLAPGDHVAVCFLPDPATGKRHPELGVAMPFSVAA